MYRVKSYVFPESLEEAWTLKQKKPNRIMAGGMWMRLGKSRFNTMIDLSSLGLDSIIETEDEFIIGCMTPLRALETAEPFNHFFNGAPGKAVSPIVGTQFRNMATVGGSIYGRFGFSDVLTVFMVLNAEIEMYKGGMIPIREFAEMGYDRDILVNVHVKKSNMQAAIKSLRLTKTDFPVLVVAASRLEGEWQIAVGARPGRAKLAEAARALSAEPAAEEIETLCDKMAEEYDFGSNMRASAEYRKSMCRVLTKRAIDEIMKGGVR